MKLVGAKKLQNAFKSNQNETLKWTHKSEEQKSALKILNCFTNHEKLLLNYLMNIPEICLRLNRKQNMEKVSKS